MNQEARTAAGRTGTAIIDAVRTAIVAKLNTVSGIGVVHGYQRHAASQKGFKALYVTDSRLLGFFVRRTAAREVSATSTYSRVVYDWRIEGFMALEDGRQSEILFDRLIESIRDVFRYDETLGGVVNTTFVDGRVGLQLDDIGPSLLSGALCHHARMTLSTQIDCDLAAPDIDGEGDGFARAHVTWDLAGPDGESEARDTIRPEQDD